MPLLVTTGPTRLAVRLPRQHLLFHPIKQMLANKATVWDFEPRTRKWSITAQLFTYYPDEELLCLPIGYLEELKRLAALHHDTVVTEPRPPNPIRLVEIGVPKGITPRPEQVTPIEFFTSPHGLPRRGLELQTGKGKTFITIQSIAQMGCAAMVVCSGLTEQWVREFLRFTDLKPDEIYTIKTRASIEHLFEHGWVPKIFVCSLATLRLYALGQEPYAGLAMPYPKFLHHFGIGIKVIDEVHLNVHAVAIIDIFSNVANNWYLSATFRRSSGDFNKIFNLIYPHGIKCEGQVYDRYVDAYYVKYRSRALGHKINTPRGYSQARFEHQLLKSPTKQQAWMEFIAGRVDVHFLRLRAPGERALILVSLTQSAECICAYLRQRHKNLEVITFLGNDKDEKCLTADIIITVPKKGGTGRDIPNLRTVINLVSTQSSEALEQWMGRLRKLPKSVPVFVHCYDPALTQHNYHMETNRTVIVPKAKTHQEIDLT